MDTKGFKRQVKNNIEKFDGDFMRDGCSHTLKNSLFTKVFLYAKLQFSAFGVTTCFTIWLKIKTYLLY